MNRPTQPSDEASLDPRRDGFRDDPLRPGYHFLPPANWINDPNGLIDHEGRFHLFYQHNPKAPVWGNMTWGHATSSDLVHWSDHPHALEPVDAFDRGGCFSGCAIPVNDRVHLIYTGVVPGSTGEAPSRQVQNIAIANDTGGFDKLAINPVLADPPPGFQSRHFRDPFVWRDDFGEGECWWMALCSSTDDNRGAVLLYRSEDLHSWTPVGPLFIEPEKSDRFTHECPNLFRLGARWMLITSPQPTARCFGWLGKFDGSEFSTDTDVAIDGGDCVYAPLTFQDRASRRILFGWCRENRSREEQVRAGWSGCLTLPRELRPPERKEHDLFVAPIAEIEELRQVCVSSPEHVRGEFLEVETIFAPGRGQAPLIEARYGDSPEPALSIGYDWEEETLLVNQCRARLFRDEREPLQLRVFFDRSIVEVFANQRIACATRIYPQSGCIERLDVAPGCGAFDAHILKPVWPVNPTS